MSVIQQTVLTSADLIPTLSAAQHRMLHALGKLARGEDKTATWAALTELGHATERLDKAYRSLVAAQGLMAGGFEVEGEEVQVNEPGQGELPEYFLRSNAWQCRRLVT